MLVNLPHSDFSRRRDGGFSLIEILCVIALLGAVTAWIAYNHTGLGTFLTRQTPEEVFRRAADEARYLASMKNVPVRLTWNEAAPYFRFSSSGQSIEVDPKLYGEDQLFFDGKLELSFAPYLPSEREPRRARSEQIPTGEAKPFSLVFEPSGVSPSGVVRFIAENGTERSLSLDAFSAGAYPLASDFQP